MNSFIIYLIYIVATCSSSGGTYILKIKIHTDELTLNKIVGVERLTRTFKNKGNREIGKNYFNRIFNDLNEDLERYGVQLEGDYSAFHFDELGLIVDKQKICTQQQLAMLINQIITPQLSYPNTDGLGLRIVMISCDQFDPVQIPFFTIPNAGCGRIGTIFVIDPFTLKPQIKLLLRGFITNGIGMFSPLSSRLFKESLCIYARKCSKNNGSLGVLNDKISRIRHKMFEEPPEESSHSEKGMFKKN
ncbi:hypothetical protein P3W45_001212 [Vairimorpha bombi]|jgi:hypothetical protein